MSVCLTKFVFKELHFLTQEVFSKKKKKVHICGIHVQSTDSSLTNRVTNSLLVKFYRF